MLIPLMEARETAKFVAAYDAGVLPYSTLTYSSRPLFLAEARAGLNWSTLGYDLGTYSGVEKVLPNIMMRSDLV
jgi:hypothetical protein